MARARRLGRAVPRLAQRRGRLLRRRLRRVRRVEATRGLEGCGRLFGAVLAVSWIFAPLYYQSRLRLLMNEQECGDSQSLEINQLSFVLITCFRLLGILSGHIFASVRLRTVDAGQASPTALHHRFARPCWNRLLERYLRFFRCSRKPVDKKPLAPEIRRSDPGVSLAQLFVVGITASLPKNNPPPSKIKN